MSYSDILIKSAYLLGAILFIIGIKRMNKPATARRGNQVSAIGMLIAIVVTLLQLQIITLPEVMICIAIGSGIGYYVAYKVKMTQMPEMVALFNGFGGLASLGVGLSDYWFKSIENGMVIDNITLVSILLSVLIGGVTFTGSYIAFAKLNGRISGNAIVFKGQHILNLLLLLASCVAGGFVMWQQDMILGMYILAAISLLLGVLVVIPIGGADMPVVISLLNSYSGMAACATGFVLNNYMLIVAGALVGSSGIILTDIMCKGMNRSLLNVVMGGFGQTSATAVTVGGKSDLVVKEVGVEEAAILFESASSVVIVPGYGMAVAQAQHIIKELMELLLKKNINVRFAIHPVAGRMPGHMNVLLAEANVPYDRLLEPDQIDDDLSNTDIVFIVGANDVVNPAARHDKSSPIYGMPIINADKAKTVIVSKRSMASGYAGIENELFGYPNCLMLFGDAKATLTKVVNEIKEM
ncbi:MAG: NAD(P)(+) transhydrogenase (Re/Si-specific) subunit beta [Saprospiraceae bacterium]|nr:NAD(P)(+) transhydrogenase (Re/Si-specific) subunit beta [Saprospiraceae bacterium]